MDEVAFAARFGEEQRVEPDSLRGPEHRGHVPMWQRPYDLEGLSAGDERPPVGEPLFDDFDQIARQIGKVAERFVLDLPAFAKGPPEQHGLVDLAFVRLRDGRDVDLAWLRFAHEPVVAAAALCAWPWRSGRPVS